MASATMNVLTLYNWTNDHDEPDLFRDFVVPEEVDKDVVVDAILLKAAPFEILYPDPDVLRANIGIWSQSRITIWNRWADSWTKAEEFNQLENFDRTEEETIELSGTDENENLQTRNLSGSDNRTLNLQDQRTANLQDQRTANLQDQRTLDLTDERTADLETEETRNLTDKRTDNLQDQRTANLTEGETRNLVDEHKVSAFDVSTYSPKDQDTHTGTDTKTTTGTDTTVHSGTSETKGTGTDTVKQTGTDTMEHTGTDTLNQTGTDTTKTTGTDTMAKTGTDNLAHTDTGTVRDAGSVTYGKETTRNWRGHGNIGVTSLAQLLDSYNTASEEWDLIDRITKEFVGEFCLMVY